MNRQIFNFGLAHITVWAALIVIGYHSVADNRVYAAYIASLYLLVKTNDWYWAAKISASMARAGIVDDDPKP